MTSKSREDNRWVRLAMIVAVCVAVTVAMLFLHSRARFITETEDASRDMRLRFGRQAPMDPRLVFVGIGKPSYRDDIREEETTRDPILKQLRGNFPWTREVWAEFIERLMSAGAKVVVLDIVFATEGVGDAKLAAVLAKYPNKVVIGWNASEPDEVGSKSVNLLLPSQSILPNEGLASAASDPRIGFVSIWAEQDGKVRKGYYRPTLADIRSKLNGEATDYGQDVVMETLSARALRLMGETDKLPAPGEYPLVRFAGPPGAFRQIPLWHILFPRMWKDNFQSGAVFKDKVILVGPTANIFQDKHETPFRNPASTMLGPEVHLNLMNAALTGSYLRDATSLADHLLILLGGGLALGMALVTRRAFLRTFIATAIAAAFLWAVFWAYQRQNVYLLAVAPVVTLLLASVLTLGIDFILENLGRMKLKATMAFYFSPKVMEAVLANPGSMDAKSAEVTLLLTDLRNSTPLAEKLGPAGMFGLLNHVFEAETTAVMAQDGSLEHFLGDQFLTYWGAPQPQPDGPNQALRAAINLIKSMEEVKATQPLEVQELFGYGVAIHCGSVLVGNKGSSKRLDYGLVGDTVNEAARIESLTKYYHVTLLVSRECFAQLTNPGTHRLLDRTIVKGKSKPVELFEIENPRTPPNYGELVRAWDAAFADYTAGKFAEARPIFAKLAEQFDDGPSKVMMHRCDELVAHPPTDWNGVWKMESK